MGKRSKQKLAYLAIIKRVEICTTEAELEEVSDMAEEAVQVGYITKKAYKAIEEALDDRLNDLVAEGII